MTDAPPPPPPVPPFASAPAGSLAPPPQAPPSYPPPGVGHPEPGGKRRRLWVVVVALLGVVAVVIAIAIVAGRGGKSSGSTAATTVPATGVAAWFKAAATLPCVPGTLIGGATQAERCTDGAVTGRFYELVTARRAALDLAAVAREYGVTERGWSSGRYITYAVAGRPVVLWSYTGEPYLGSASGPSAATWWITTGRVRA